MTNEHKLLPCPFCNSSTMPGVAWAQCSNSGCPAFHIKTTDFRAWNTRTAPKVAEGLPERMQWYNDSNDDRRIEAEAHNVCLDAVAPLVALLQGENEALRAEREVMILGTQQFQADRDALRARNAELVKLLQNLRNWVNKLPVGTRGAAAKGMRIYAALSPPTEGNRS